jgi:hypothetical protein
VTYVPTISLGPVNALRGESFWVDFPSEAPPRAVAAEEDEDDDDEDSGDTGGAQGIGDLMKSGAYQDALDDDESRSLI